MAEQTTTNALLSALDGESGTPRGPDLSTEEEKTTQQEDTFAAGDAAAAATTASAAATTLGGEAEQDGPDSGGDEEEARPKAEESASSADGVAKTRAEKRRRKAEKKATAKKLAQEQEEADREDRARQRAAEQMRKKRLREQTKRETNPVYRGNREHFESLAPFDAFDIGERGMGDHNPCFRCALGCRPGVAGAQDCMARMWDIGQGDDKAVMCGDTAHTAERDRTNGFSRPPGSQRHILLLAASLAYPVAIGAYVDISMSGAINAINQTVTCRGKSMRNLLPLAADGQMAHATEFLNSFDYESFSQSELRRFVVLAPFDPQRKHDVVRARPLFDGREEKALAEAEELEEQKVLFRAAKMRSQQALKPPSDARSSTTDVATLSGAVQSGPGQATPPRAAAANDVSMADASLTIRKQTTSPHPIPERTEEEKKPGGIMAASRASSKSMPSKPEATAGQDQTRTPAVAKPTAAKSPQLSVVPVVTGGAETEKPMRDDDKTGIASEPGPAPDTATDDEEPTAPSQSEDAGATAETASAMEEDSAGSASEPDQPEDDPEEQKKLDDAIALFNRVETARTAAERALEEAQTRHMQVIGEIESEKANAEMQLKRTVNELKQESASLSMMRKALHDESGDRAGPARNSREGVGEVGSRACQEADRGAVGGGQEGDGESSRAEGAAASRGGGHGEDEGGRQRRARSVQATARGDEGAGGDREGATGQ